MNAIFFLLLIGDSLRDSWSFNRLYFPADYNLRIHTHFLNGFDFRILCRIGYHTQNHRLEVLRHLHPTTSSA